MIPAEVPLVAVTRTVPFAVAELLNVNALRLVAAQRLVPLASHRLVTMLRVLVRQIFTEFLRPPCEKAKKKKKCHDRTDRTVSCGLPQSGSSSHTQPLGTHFLVSAHLNELGLHCCFLRHSSALSSLPSVQWGFESHCSADRMHSPLLQRKWFGEHVVAPEKSRIPIKNCDVGGTDAFAASLTVRFATAVVYYNADIIIAHLYAFS